MLRGLQLYHLKGRHAKTHCDTVASTLAFNGLSLGYLHSTCAGLLRSPPAGAEHGQVEHRIKLSTRRAMSLPSAEPSAFRRQASGLAEPWSACSRPLMACRLCSKQRMWLGVAVVINMLRGSYPAPNQGAGRQRMCHHNRLSPMLERRQIQDFGLSTASERQQRRFGRRRKTLPVHPFWAPAAPMPQQHGKAEASNSRASAACSHPPNFAPEQVPCDGGCCPCL